MLPLRRARALSLAALLAATVAALPSLEWCPIAEWLASRCETAVTCEPGAGSCAAVGPRGCDREADPLPFSDRVWCIGPPVTAVMSRPGELPRPEPDTPLAGLELPLVPAPVTALAPVRNRPEPGPPALRAPHAPPQPRAPPAC